MISVCVVGAKTSGNLGAIARVMANFGASKLYLVSPQCEVITDESKARAMRAVGMLENAKIISSIDEVGADYFIATSAKLGSGHNLNRLYITPDKIAMDDNLHYSVVLGREDKGLFNEELKQCHLLVHIPTDDRYKTMNISHALAIVLYEMRKKKRSATRLASRRDMEELFNRFHSLASKADESGRLEEVFRAVINRTFIKKKEANALIGLFKKICSQ